MIRTPCMFSTSFPDLDEEQKSWKWLDKTHEISNTTVENWLSAIRLSMPVRFQTKMWRKDSVQFHYPCPRFQTKVSNRFSAIRLSMSEISNKRVEKAWQRRLVLLRLLNNSTRGIPFSDSLCGTASLQIYLFSIAADDDDLNIIGAVCLSVCHKSHYFRIQGIW